MLMSERLVGCYVQAVQALDAERALAMDCAMIRSIKQLLMLQHPPKAVFKSA